MGFSADQNRRWLDDGQKEVYVSYVGGDLTMLCRHIQFSLVLSFQYVTGFTRLKSKVAPNCVLADERSVVAISLLLQPLLTPSPHSLRQTPPPLQSPPFYIHTQHHFFPASFFPGLTSSSVKRRDGPFQAGPVDAGPSPVHGAASRRDAQLRRSVLSRAHWEDSYRCHATAHDH